MTSMKRINYRGGIASFYLPSSWIEEYQPEGGGTFFEDRPDLGALRINVISIEKPLSKVGPADAIDHVIAEISGTHSVHRLPSGAVIAQSSQTANEDGNELLIYFWHIGVPIAANYFRIIIFTYTTRAAQKSDPNIEQELAMLNRSISDGEYSTARGVSGNYIHEPGE